MAGISKQTFYDNFLIEIRPRLQSVNVLINLKQPLKSPKIFIQNNVIFIDEYITYTIPLKNLNIVPDSLNNVQITDRFLSFRFSTTNDGFGTFKSEILHLKNENDINIDSVPFFNNNVKLEIQCANCLQVLCKEVFKRVLPLPSEHSDSSDWFCHAHNIDKNDNLDPQINDIFYSTCFAHVNSNLIKGHLNSTTNLVCSRCLAWIGNTVNKNCFRIWFNTVRFSDGIKTYTTVALNDVYLTIRKVLKDALLNSAKIILQCQVNKDQIDYMLLWIIEKRLNVLSNDCSTGFNNVFMAKVLFKFISGWNSLVNQWSNDVMVSNVNVSKPMMVEVLKHLYSMNKLLPKEWNFSNDFYISYLPLYNND